MKRYFILSVLLLCALSGFGQSGSGEVKKVAILPVVDKENNISYGIELSLRGSFEEAVSHAQGYEAYDRMNLDEIMKEEKFQHSGMVSDEEAAILGRKAGVSFILVVEAAYLDDTHEHIIVLASLKEIMTARMWSNKSDGPVQNLNQICNELVEKLFNIKLDDIGNHAQNALQQGQGQTTDIPNKDVQSSNSNSTNDDAAQPNLTVQVNGVSFEMVFVKGGFYEVNLPDYYIGKYEVTQELWQAVMGKNPSRFKLGGNYPVEKVSYKDIVNDFLPALNRITGRTFALPTDTQWKYAAHGGNKSHNYKFSGGNIIGDVAWYYRNSRSQTHPVGQKLPNELGIHDMTGNVSEWCSDVTYILLAAFNAVRGGSYNSHESACADSKSVLGDSTLRQNLKFCHCGFRLVMLP